MSEDMKGMRKEMMELVNKSQQESTQKMNALQEMMEQMMISINKKNRTAAATTLTVEEKQSARRNLFPHLLSPVTAAKKATHQSQGLNADTPVSTIHSLSHDPSYASSDRVLSEETRRALQKGLAKPPFFSGNTDEKSENVSTWWRQVCSYADTFEKEVQATVIKSYMRGAAALWLESREGELNRGLTVEELADGLTQEYGSEVTSKAALQRIESLTMAHKDCSSLNKYNTVFNSQYNLLNIEDQPFAVRAYTKGLLPAYQKIILAKSLSTRTLAEARAAATLAAAEQETVDLAFTLFREQKNRSVSETHKQKRYPTSSATSDSYQPTRGRVWENKDKFKVDLGSISSSLHEDEDEETNTNMSDNNVRPEGQVAAVMAGEQNNRSKGGGNSREIRLTPEETAMLREENRCFRCHKPNHRRVDCRSAPATERPKSLKGDAPSRK
jgi:hypothetical protein